MQEFMDRIVDVLYLELLLQLVLAVLLGGAIGLERELSGKPAGLRTNILICVGAALFTTLSMKMSLGRGDPARIAAQILPGVGFIGAGTILHMRGSVTGLTSAATIWVVAAVGMALGAGAYGEALGAALLVLIVLQGLGWVEGYLARAATHSHLRIHAKAEPTALEDLEALVRRTGLEIERTVSRRENVDLVIEFDVRGPKRLHDQLLVGIVHHPVVRAVSTGE
jgi:putative Mg2+ transporter-C (MgtC) family protein